MLGAMRWRWRLAALVVIIVAVAAVVWTRYRARPASLPLEEAQHGDILQVGPARVTVEVARTMEEWKQGLAGRETLPEDAGMLFLFPAPEPRVFWMKDTSIPLDIFWIRSGRVAGLTPNARPEPGVPEDRLTRYPPAGAVDQVLEVNAGWAERHGVGPGETVQVLPRKKRRGP